MGVLLSIVLTLHNSVDDVTLIRRNIAAMKSSRMELVIIDDGSSDGTQNHLDGLAALWDRTKILRNTASVGVARARNYALSHVSGEYVWFVDSDDEWNAETALKALAKGQGADVVVARAQIVEGKQTRCLNPPPGRRLYGGSDMFEFLAHGAIHGYLWDKLFRRSILGKDPFAPLTSQSDFTGVIRVADKCPTLAGVDFLIYVHRLRRGSITQSKNPNLDNLVLCFELFQSMHERHNVSKNLVRYFSVWFVAIPAAFTPSRNGAPRETVVKGIRLAKALLRITALTSTWRYSKATFVRASIVRLAGPLVPSFYLTARRIKGVNIDK
ncbi:glycosyltransferase family 2 protein [Arthrobacter sunyaminii]|uniref:Glycosyltransferase n=1 Tax=Arthrobacter sunyaminii TaxID=2816859 RepID=A0A975S7C7_9MICC|nr:glycosyltransferase family 2 protein [Arthrobacter sunyaminii]MBO0908160.1 glycosyltransferase family 2 protein [Arthrobacter sunyaminii]QWQ37168.1 glycosyltransferase [Arthrobacter sunyaminii]